MQELLSIIPEAYWRSVSLILLIFGLLYIIKLRKTNAEYKKLIMNGSNNNMNQYQKSKNKVNGYKAQNNSGMNSDAYNYLLSEKSLLEQKFNYYQLKVKENLNNLFTIGELTLIEAFREMLTKKEFSDWYIYGQLQRKGFDTYRVYFLVVSENGVFVVESKAWKGLTLIYEPNHPNLLKNSIYNDYGKKLGLRSTEFQVFNISNGKNGSLSFNEYTNPIEQARGYSRDLRNVLNCHVKNLVVFQQNDKYQVKYNDCNLGKVSIDQFTTITTNKGIENYFSTAATEHINVDEINQLIRNNYNYAICLTASTVNEPPWNVEY